MAEETAKTESLKALAAKIVEYSGAADDKTLEAAALVHRARERVEAGEAGDVTWYVWARRNIKLSLSRLRELDVIGRADDPRRMLGRLRRINRERVARFRAREAALRNGGQLCDDQGRPKGDRERLMEWAKLAPLSQVREALAFVRELGEREEDAGAPACVIRAEEGRALTLH